MKRFRYYHTGIVLAMLLIVSCSQEDDYRKYLEGGEIYYPGRIELARVYSGREQVKLWGLFISDPNVTQCVVYWNIRQDSVVFPVVRTNIYDTLDEVIPIEEGIHNFEFITMDAKGNRSVVVNATGNSYGAKFQAQLSNRPIIDTAYVSASDSLMIAWGSMDLSTGAYETQVQYNLGTNRQILNVPIDTDTTYIMDYDGSGIEYRTHFLPDSTCIDVFRTGLGKVIAD